MTAISNEDLTKYHARIRGKTVLVTGAGAGIGRTTSKLFASYGSAVSPSTIAKVVVADRDLTGVEQTVQEIQTDLAGEAVGCKCDVTLWEDLVATYELAIERFGSVDVVIANAGVGEIGPSLVNRFGTDWGAKEFPAKPWTTTVDVNLTGVLYTVHLAQHYLQLNRINKHSEPSLKSIILIGSMASWVSLTDGPIYSATKHAVLGLMRSLDEPFARKGIRISCIHPFFARTAIVPLFVRLLLAGLPLTTVQRISGTIFYAASCSGSNYESSSDSDALLGGGEAFWVPDGGTPAPAFMLSRKDFKHGVYEFIDTKSNSTSIGLSGPQYHIQLISDLIPWVWKMLMAVTTMGVLGGLHHYGLT